MRYVSRNTIAEWKNAGKWGREMVYEWEKWAELGGNPGDNNGIRCWGSKLRELV